MGKKEFNVNRFDHTNQEEHPMYTKGGCQLDGKVYRQMPPSGRT
jgi:hypothetical protein